MSENSRNKVLIITYYWPPAGGPGVQRWLKFAKYLPEFGWEPIIYTPENPSYPIIDEQLLHQIPKEIEIIKTKIWEPYQLAEKISKKNKKYKSGQFDIGKKQSLLSRLSVFIRGNFFIPDARVFWIKPSIAYLTHYIQENNIETIVTTGPPHSLHLIGLALKKTFPKLKWIADFRDPWTEISYYKHLKLLSSSDKKHRQLERSVFENADVTLATSFTDAENFNKNGANAITITNGFDEDDFKTVKTNNQDKQKWVLSYVGVLEQLRNPEILWNVLDTLCKENPEFKKAFQLKFVGKVDDAILNSLYQLSFSKNIVHLGYKSHDESLQEMLNSHFLLITNFNSSQSKGIIPGKIFEYLATGNSIISFGPKDSDVAKILEESKAGQQFSYDEFEEVSQFILQEFEDWKNNSHQKNAPQVMHFSRKYLTEKLSKIL